MKVTVEMSKGDLFHKKLPNGQIKSLILGAPKQNLTVAVRAITLKSLSFWGDDSATSQKQMLRENKV